MLHQVDGLSPLHVSDETRLSINHEAQDLTFGEQVVCNLHAPNLPFVGIASIHVQ